MGALVFVSISSPFLYLSLLSHSFSFMLPVCPCVCIEIKPSNLIHFRFFSIFAFVRVYKKIIPFVYSFCYILFFFPCICLFSSITPSNLRLHTSVCLSFCFCICSFVQNPFLCLLSSVCLSIIFCLFVYYFLFVCLCCRSWLISRLSFKNQGQGEAKTSPSPESTVIPRYLSL